MRNHPLSLAREIIAALPRGQWHGPYGMASCPVPGHGRGRGDQNPSLSIHDRDDGNIVVRCFADCDWRDVKEELRRRGLLSEPAHYRPLRPDEHVATGDTPKPDDWRPIVPVPKDAPPEYPHHPLGKPDKAWPYHDAEGNLLFLACRFNKPDGRKDVLPLSYCSDTTGQRSWRWKALPEPRPLYGLDRLASRPDAPVLIVEGEKAADAAETICPEFVAVTSPGGCGAVDKADWTPLNGCNVTIWPDADNTGDKYAADVARLCREEGAKEIRIFVPPEGTKPGWDAADAVEEPWWGEQIKDLIDTAKPFGSGPDMSVLRQNRRKPPEFPLDAFGPFWSGWLKSAAEGAGAPVDYTACALLTTAAALIGNARWVEPWEGWCEPPVLWIGLVGNPGDGKSPGVDPVLDLLRTLEDEIAGDFESVLRKYEEHKEAARAARTQWEEEVKKAVKNKTLPPLLPETAVEPEAPIRPRLHISDLTPEALGKLLSIHPKGLLFWRDELSGWLGSFDRYGGAGAERALWLEAYGGRQYVVDRIKLGKPIRIPHLSVSVAGTIQPDKLSTAMLKGDDDGLPGRFIWVWPDPLPPSRPSRTANNVPALNALRRLSELQMLKDDQGVPHPIVVPLASVAADLFHEWRLEHHGDASGTGGLIASSNAKMPGRVLRLAIVLEFLWWCANDNSVEPGDINEQAVAYAAGLVEDYFKPMGARAYGDAALPEEDRLATTLARWIAKDRPTVVNARELRRDVRLPGLTMKGPVRMALDALVEANWLIEPPRSSGPGRTKEDYRVNPRLWTVLS